LVLVLRKFLSSIIQKCDSLTQFFINKLRNKGLDKEGKKEMSPFYVEGDRRDKG